MKIVARTQNQLSSQDKPLQMLRGEISRSDFHFFSGTQLIGDMTGVLAQSAQNNCLNK